MKNNVATILKYKDDADWMLYANSVFLTNCQSCHGPDGSGVVGPNLTDDFYKNVKKITDIAEVINNGAAGGSMPAWRTRLHPNEVILMAAYVAGLRGKNLKGRGPEGEKIDPWPAASAQKSPRAKRNRATRSDFRFACTQCPSHKTTKYTKHTKKERKPCSTMEPLLLKTGKC